MIKLQFQDIPHSSIGVIPVIRRKGRLYSNFVLMTVDVSQCGMFGFLSFVYVQRRYSELRWSSRSAMVNTLKCDGDVVTLTC